MGGTLTREAFELLTVQDVFCSDLDLLETIENIELGQVQRGVTVDHGRVLEHDEIEPTAATTTTGSDAPF